MNIQEKVIVLRELRKQHNYFINEMSNLAGNLERRTMTRLRLIEKKIEQILKTI
jgi:hypothetical protein